MKLNSLYTGTLSALLLATVGCATSGDLKRLQGETNSRQDQLRQELNLLRQGLTSLQRDIQTLQEGKTPVFHRVQQEMAAISTDLGRNSKAVMLMGEAVAAIVQQLSATTGTEEKKPKP
jgi:hypothetical protein